MLFTDIILYLLYTQESYVLVIGRCYVRSLENKQPRPQILRDVIAISGQRLLPCHSTLFQFANPVFSLPEEEEISRCVRECRLEGRSTPEHVTVTTQASQLGL